jgi:excinuclease UvrABC helicase subunit UvrB
MVRRERDRSQRYGSTSGLKTEAYNQKWATWIGRLVRTLEDEMHEAAKDLRFEEAARLRDEIADLKRELREVV